ncbi:MAG TPA: glycoside hydrolase family 15 protein [Longimicrobiales bacterium]|nr:glycoside hydrolase family 15 protein [Longimicrobiales bacterium]
MGCRIEDHALIGNTRTAALVGNDGCMDWLCLPRFDSPACFASLLGDHENGCWRISPAIEARTVRRSYRDGTLVLDTEFHTGSGAFRVIDCMPPWPGRTDIVRVVEGLSGRVPVRMELVIRYGNGSIVPWVRNENGSLIATAGPDTLIFRSDVPTHGEDHRTCAEFEITEGQRQDFVLTYMASHEARPLPIDPDASIAETERWWREWMAHCTYDGEWPDMVRRSLMTLKALTYSPTGGIVAAPTTSLPELIGGVRNWDYRYCWLRDATFTLYALLLGGYREEAREWREWLVRAAAGRPHDLQILYGLAGERHVPEFEVPWLDGYEGSRPVRVGNAAAGQFQLDVYGEVMDTLHLARAAGLDAQPHVWRIQRSILDFLESNWERPDNGIWEMRGDPKHFTHSRVMAWVAVDRGIKGVERFGLDGPLDQWRALRSRIHDDVCRNGYDADANTFVQQYGSKELDASLLMIPLVGFLPPDSRRVHGTTEAIERSLVYDGGLVLRYRTDLTIDGLPPGEGYFLPCSFWLVDNLAMMGRRDEALATFERLLDLCNDVGLIAEEYDPAEKRMLGNFPQALTHVALINAARNLSSAAGGPAEERAHADWWHSAEPTSRHPSVS